MGEQGREFRTVRGYQIKQQATKTITASMEDYLEMIYRLAGKKGYTRMGDLASALNVQPPSASKMVQKLADMGYLQFEKYGVIELSKKGQEHGQYLLKRHETLERFLSIIGVKEQLLEETEKIEHYISPETIGKIILLVEFMEDNPEWKQAFYDFKKHEG
ncbi:transcriptional regulator MntR [Syntrophomonas wolfei]|uniref:Manganese transport regulator n=2 Tax=Syntrophomonas wolfei TaxID=863 RepID=A0A354YXE6_9FIRM|nr:transcriptional regulator MntR [Syntrophomonas wolfei]HBK52892.1 transcriptional regulator MntR [Syntrophomonas wolfei]